MTHPYYPFSISRHLYAPICCSLLRPQYRRDYLSTTLPQQHYKIREWILREKILAFSVLLDRTLVKRAHMSMFDDKSPPFHWLYRLPTEQRLFRHLGWRSTAQT